MKKIFSTLLGLVSLGNVALADVVGPIGGMAGKLGVWHMHGRGRVFQPMSFIISFALCFLLLLAIMFIVTKIMKSKNAEQNTIKKTRIGFLVAYILLIVVGTVVVFLGLN